MARVRLLWLQSAGLIGALACSAAPTPSGPAPQGPQYAAGTQQSTHIDTLETDPIGPPIEAAPMELAPRTNAELLRAADLHQAIDDCRRLRLVAGFQEMRQGLLRLAVGDGFDRGTSVAYNLARLYSGYFRSLDHHGEVVVELWRGDEKIGEYTSDGLLLGPGYGTPRH